MLEKLITSIIAPEEFELSPPPTLKFSGIEESDKLIETFYSECEDTYTKDYIQEASKWSTLRCKHLECDGWISSSFSELVEHYEELHSEVPVSLLLYGFSSSY